MRIEPTPRGLQAAFFRQKYKFLLSVVLILAGGLALLHFTTPLYKSEGSILVRFGEEARPTVSLSDNQGGHVAVSEDYRQEMLQSYAQILQSHDLLAPVVKQFGGVKLYPALAKLDLTTDQADGAALSKLMAKDLEVKPATTGDIIEISVLNPDPHLAQQVVSRLIQVFVDRQSDVFNKPQTEFLSEQMEHAQAELTKQQQTLQEFKARTGMTSIDEELAQLMEQKNDVQTSAIESVKDAQTNVDQIKAKEAELMTTYRPDSFTVESLHRSLVVAEGQLYAKQQDLRAATLASTHVPPAETASDTGEARKSAPASSALVSHINDIDNRIAQIEGQRKEYNELSMQEQIAEKNYKAFKDQLEQARVSDTLNQEKITQIAILDAPGVPILPVQPKAPLIELLTAFAAILFGSAVVVVFETLDQTFTTPWQVSHLLQVPVLASFTVSRKRTPHGRHA